MILGLSYYFILMDLFLYSFFGWIYESTFVSVKEKHVVNRGFLVGPILPLYGFGGTLVYVFLRPLVHFHSLLFVGGMVLATFVEYITAVGMEKLFHAQWWDYSKEPHNFQGRVALIPSMFWGILTLFAFDFFQPFISWIIDTVPVKIGQPVLGIILAITACDITYSTITTINFSKQLDRLYHFKNEMEEQLRGLQMPEIPNIITTTTQEFHDRLSQFAEKIPASLENPLANSEIMATLENKFKLYKENHTSFIKKNPFFGNRRIIKAFPTMKYLPQEFKKLPRAKKYVKVSDFISQLALKKNKKEN